MIDFHSHILPGIDDGSQSVEESLLMLDALRVQGVDTVIATPHYHADHRSPESFLARREAAWERLRPSLPAHAPRILLGAEVRYYPGVSRMEELPALCVEGTDLLLLEMPFAKWSERQLQEVLELTRCGRFTVIMAHIERYYLQQKRAVWDRLLENGALMQVNADVFCSFAGRVWALRLLREGRIQLLGSDCHDSEQRPPRMDEAAAVIAARLGERPLHRIERLGRSLLSSEVEE